MVQVLSLFDGISAGQLALQRANIPVKKYYASEIDKYATKVTQHNFPNTIQLGDIKEWRQWVIDWSSVSIIMGGSPCQSFSVAGKGEGFAGQSGVIEYYFQIVEYVKTLNPSVIFLLENVRMKEEWQNIISNRLKVEPTTINSNLVSAQNRKRLYWSNIQNITQPEDKNTLLKDVLENGFVDRDKAFCLDANYWKGTNVEQYLKKHRRQIVFTPEGFRKLTPLECERLQTFPENYTNILSNTQRYKTLGNAWTVDVIAHIFTKIHLRVGEEQL